MTKTKTADRVWTDAERAANRAATYAEWGMESDWSEWINDQANNPDTTRAYAEFPNRT